MEEQMDLARWSEVGEKEKKFFSPEYDTTYRVKIARVELIRRAFNQDEPKLKVRCHLATVNGEPSGKIWETGSFSVMRELKKHIQNEEWVGDNIAFLLKKKKDGDKTSYVFEELPEA